MTPSDWLPPLVLLRDSDGDWDAYLDVVYSWFKADFLDSLPAYPGKRFALKRHPLKEGRERTFWHIITEGPDEYNRQVREDRCERIRWPRPIIEAMLTGNVLVWKNKRKRETRVLLALPDFSYLVVLADRGEYILPWTAYPVTMPHYRKRLRQEYEAYR